jgi:hypothetical protein
LGKGEVRRQAIERAVGVLAVVVLAALAAAPAPAPAATKQAVNAIGDREVGEGEGRFNGARGVAVNQTGAGDVPAGTFYVVDSLNRRVQRFGPTADFVSAWGVGVRDGTNEFEVCPRECRKGRQGAKAGQFFQPRGIAVDQATGKVYVSDPAVTNSGDVVVFSAKGSFEGAFGLGVATLSSGVLEFCTEQTCRVPAFPADARGGVFPYLGIDGLAVDGGGNVYVANGGLRRVDVFRPLYTGGIVTGVEFLRAFGWGVRLGNDEFEVCTVATECREGKAGNGLGQFAVGSPSNVAVDSEGNVYALDRGNRRVQKFDASSVPVASGFGAGALDGVFGAGAELLNLAVDPSVTPSHLLVMGSRLGSSGRLAVAELDGAGANALGATRAHGEDLTIAAGSGLAATRASLAGNVYVTTDANAVLHGAYVLGEAPTIEAPVVTGTSATLKGTVVSGGLGVTYRFEYSADGVEWARAPAVDADAGIAAGTVEVEAKVSGLTGSQRYRARLVQDRAAAGGVASSATVEFTTPPSAPAIAGTVAAPIADTSATFNAHLDPQNEATSYRFEYGTADCAASPCAALPLAQAEGGGLRLVAQTATGLQPGTLYHYRLVAVNATGPTAGPDATFETAAAGRWLPDDRGYELVTPADTGAVIPAATLFGGVDGAGCFNTFSVSPSGASVLFGSKGGALPGMVVNGLYDLYESARGTDGWSTTSKSPPTIESAHPQGALCGSSDHRYSTLLTGGGEDEGGLVIGGEPTSYLRVPGAVDPACSPASQGRFELVGCGTLGTDPRANAEWIDDDGSHVVFTASKKLETAGPADGRRAIYDRTPGGPTRVVSLLPGGVTPSGDSFFQNASEDGGTVSFSTAEPIGAGATLFVHREDGTTIPLATGSSVPAGSTLTCTPGSGVSATSKTVQWLRNGSDTPGATAPTYTTVAADAGKAIQCQAFAGNATAGATQTSNPPVLVEPVPGGAPPAPPGAIAAPSQSGTINVPGPSAARTLTCATGTWGGSPAFSFRWYRNGVLIPGETASTLAIPAGSQAVAASFQCAVTGTNAAGGVTRASANRNTSPAPANVLTASAVTKGLTIEPAGISEDGGKAFYVQAGNVFSVDTATGVRTMVASGGDAAPVNVSADGSHVYFIATAVLSGAEENAFGARAEAGKSNLYVWAEDGGGAHFIAVLDPADAGPLRSWAGAVGPTVNASKGLANDPSRSSRDGRVLLFESRADVTGYDSGGHVEIYYYDDERGSIECVSCPPGGMPAAGDASLQRVSSAVEPDAPTSALVRIQNLTADTGTVFFQTEDALVPGDVNSTWDVYEWKRGQQAYLISSGTGALPSHLYGMSANGNDVFFASSERLVPQDASTVTSIYDARRGGGFAVAQPRQACQGDACQPSSGSSPSFSRPGSAELSGPGNQRGRPRCARNERRVKRGGKARCSKKRLAKRKSSHRRRSNGRGGGG